VEDARRVWIYRAVPDCLADGREPRDAASRIGSGGHGHVFFWASVSLARGALRVAIRWCYWRCCTVGMQTMRQS
jgi:hypothetical protein